MLLKIAEEIKPLFMAQGQELLWVCFFFNDAPCPSTFLPTSKSPNSNLTNSPKVSNVSKSNLALRKNERK